MNREKIAMELLKIAKNIVSYDDDVELVTDAEAYKRDFYVHQYINDDNERKKAFKVLAKAAKEYAKIVNDVYDGESVRIKKWPKGLGFTVELPTPIRSYVMEDLFTKKVKSVMKKYGITVENYLGEFD